MCGISGVINLSPAAAPLKSLLNSMISQILHRGPDDCGFYLDPKVGLAHARLSIIDVQGGQQPICNEAKDVIVVFNGEIFNYLELRSVLSARGHHFSTQTDTEVIVHAYEEYGEAFLNTLNGQFAIALWDKSKHRLILARDRVGIHPLFYTQQGDQLYFASEIKALLPIFQHAPRLNPQALDQLFTFWAPLSPATMFEHVFEVSPGEVILIQDGHISRRQYWDFSFPTDGEYCSATLHDQAQSLYELLVDAVKIRLRSDVPVGAYLSGGLDSSVVTSIIHQESDANLRTFSIGFEEQSFDESEYQREMVNFIQSQHSHVMCRNSDIADQFSKTIFHTEMPILRTAPVPMGILSRSVKSAGYKVVLTGEGADEILGGYDLFKEGKIRQFWAKNSSSRIRPLLLKRLYPYLDISKQTGRAYLEAFFGVGLGRPDLPWFSHLPRWETTAKCKEFFSDELSASLREDAISLLASSLPKNINSWSPFNRAQYIESKVLMAGYLLCSQGDRMLMSNSVEGRFPFLDHRLIEFAECVDPRLKMKVLNEKYLLKQSMQKKLPSSILARYKQPYRAPDISGLMKQGELVDFADDLSSEERISQYGYFNPKKVRRLKEKIKRGRAIGYKDNMAFVGILSTQQWHNHFIENFSNFRQS